MATLAAALLLFPLSVRGKKRGKRKPDASTVAASMQYHQRGTMAHVHGDIDGAKQAFREAIKLKPDFSYAYYRLAFVMHEQAQQERLRQLHRKRRLLGYKNDASVRVCMHAGFAGRGARVGGVAWRRVGGRRPPQLEAGIGRHASRRVPLRALIARFRSREGGGEGVGAREARGLRETPSPPYTF